MSEKWLSAGKRWEYLYEYPVQHLHYDTTIKKVQQARKEVFQNTAYSVQLPYITGLSL